jgi:hypothetical protein
MSRTVAAVLMARKAASTTVGVEARIHVQEPHAGHRLDGVGDLPDLRGIPAFGEIGYAFDQLVGHGSPRSKTTPSNVPCPAREAKFLVTFIDLQA